MWRRNGEYVEEERRVCGGGTEICGGEHGERNGEYVELTESMWWKKRRIVGRRNRKMQWKERRVCGGGTERCGERNRKCEEEEQ